MITYDSSLKIFYSTKINDQHFFSGFGTKELGDGRKADSILQFFQKINFTVQKLIILEQIHSTNIEVYQKDAGNKVEKIEDGDGVISKKDNCLLTVRTADCLPVIFVDKKQAIIGISHQGWRGSLKKMVSKMVEKMVGLGAKKDEIIAAIGPGIGFCCYYIDNDRYYQFMEEFDGYSAKIFQMRGGKRYVDLTRLNFFLLVDSGIKTENIDYFPFCTKCDKNRFFSYRRDKGSDYGEMFHFIVKTDEPKLFTDLT